MRIIRLSLTGSLLLAPSLACSLFTPATRQAFPAGYLDSPYVLPDGSAIYFLHSVASTQDILEQNPSARPVTAHLPGHVEPDGAYWWNTDLYVSNRNPDGTWGEPRNLGPDVNTMHMESSPWVSKDQTLLIFSRESVTDPALSQSFFSRRANPQDPWGTPKPLPGALGRYGETGYTDFHLTPGGNLYFWSERLEGNAALYWAERAGSDAWLDPQPLPAHLQSELDETQPWVNDEETVLYFNRRGEDGNTQLLQSLRDATSGEWRPPVAIPLAGCTDANGYCIWGEPSFRADGILYLMRFDTSAPKWRAEILLAEPRGNGFSILQPAEFRY